MFHSRIALAASLLAAIVSTTAHASDEAAQEAILVTAERATQAAEHAAASTPGGADVVSHADYADKSIVSLRDALAFSPGIYLQPRFGQEVRISIRGSGLSRGFHMRGLTLLQDGVPINLADDNGDFQELEPIFFDHLEVFRGANALRFGSGTLGGAINGVTPTGRDAAGLYLRADAGSFDTLRGLASYGGANGIADYWGAFSADTSDGDRQHARRHSVRAHGNLGVQISSGITTRFYVSHNDIDQQLPGALDLTTALQAPRTGNFAGDQARDIVSTRLQNRTTLSLGDATLNLAAFYNRKALYHPIFQVVDQQSRDKGGAFRLEWSRGPVELTLGGEARFGTVASKRYVNLDGRRGALAFDADQKARTTSLYGEARLHATDGLTLIAGAIRAEGMRKQHQSFNSFVCGPTDIDGKARFDAFSPKFGVLFAPTAQVQLYANVSRSAEFPGFIELAQVAAFVPVKAQRAWTYEMGTRGTAGIVRWDVSLYRSEIRGELLQYTVSPDVPASTFNAHRTLHQGIEAGLSLNIRDWLRLRQTYTYSDFRFRNDAQYDDNRLPVVPRHVYRAELRFGSDALHVAPNVEWVPQGAWADYTNSLKVRGYALIGATAGASVAQGIDLFVDIRNLSGKRAIGDISAAITATPSSVTFYPVERRAVSAGVRARF